MQFNLATFNNPLKTQIMNLLQRIKPELLASINLDEAHYPNLVARLKRELQAEEYSPLNLSLNTAYNLTLYAKSDLSLTTVFNFFNEDIQNEEK